MKLLPFSPRKFKRTLSHHADALGRDDRGNAAVEFAVLAPVFLFIMAVSFDMGSLIFARFQLEATISNTASYTLVHADQVDGLNDSLLAKSVALMIAGQYPSTGASASIAINDGVQANFDGATIRIDGTPASTGACYCPSGSAASFVWGSQQTCSSSCPDGANAGKYAVISAKQTYAPLFSGYNIVNDGYIYASAVVQLK
ncbi:TadE/TadG family type IV pilus assembly protein [Rhizobium hainanense]|uniref:TadE-like protein n=1 Tax=Rhizobium hainanense TaxID=52131 RepID=A0A1C3V9E3_9HYPH|nr:TadE/TadG family type IV pilus assembly protein [Rhizobium hainanense]SCB24184.1 TadE-like protein [Rhizobium hainanense]